MGTLGVMVLLLVVLIVAFIALSIFKDEEGGGISI